MKRQMWVLLGTEKRLSQVKREGGVKVPVAKKFCQKAAEENP